MKDHSKSQTGIKEVNETFKPAVPRILEYSPLRSSPARNYIRENVLTSILLCKQWNKQTLSSSFLFNYIFVLSN